MGYGEIQHGDLKITVNTKSVRSIIFTTVDGHVIDKLLLSKYDSYPRLKYKHMLIHKDRLIVIFRLIRNSRDELIRDKTTIVVKEFDMQLNLIYQKIIEINSHITVTEGVVSGSSIFVLKCSHKHRYGEGFMSIYLDLDFEVLNRTVDSKS
jgi:hypothetical protein